MTCHCQPLINTGAKHNKDKEVDLSSHDPILQGWMKVFFFLQNAHSGGQSDTEFIIL